MLRSTLLWLSRRRAMLQFVTRRSLPRAFARRFVAGETLDDAAAAVRAVNGRGRSATLDLLGESVTSSAEAVAARDQVLRIVDRIVADGVNANVSVKLTQLGLDLDPGVCRANMVAILERAAPSRLFVRVDMEGSPYTERTLRLFREHLHPRFGDLVGVVIQSMLRRSDRDVEDLIRMGARVRLVKGAYAESHQIAYSEKRDVDAAFARQAERLLDAGCCPAIATHDERLIAAAKRHVRERGYGPDRFEFQLLYGVRRDLQERLRAEGYRVRVYIPFGTHWYPYLMRRLAERPANIASITGSVIKEAFARK
ncbi:MAG: proline dehydrogenase family protein [Gemmatimonadetes bacterium]|nr:proline dehydrogenase family protein [Gemmatimonadota bacterium]